MRVGGMGVGKGGTNRGTMDDEEGGGPVRQPAV